MTTSPDERATGGVPAEAKRRLGVETVLAVAGAAVALGFFLPWFDLPDGGDRASGLDIARRGGVWVGLAAIPALGALTAIFGGLRWRLSRYAGLLTVIALLVPVGYVLAMEWPWLYSIPLLGGIAAIVAGKLGRAPWLNAPLGGALLVLTAVGALWFGDEPVFDLGGDGAAEEAGEKDTDAEDEDADADGDDTASDDEHRDGTDPLGPSATLGLAVVGPGAIDGLGVAAATPLIVLVLLLPVCGVWLLWSGLRKKGHERPLVFTGWTIIALDVYVAAIVVFGPTVVTAGPGLWMSALGGTVLLVGSRPLASRRKRAKSDARDAEKDAKADAEKAAAEKKKADARKAAEAQARKKADAKKKADAQKTAEAEAKKKPEADAKPAADANAASASAEADPKASSPPDADARERAKRAKLAKLRARKRAEAKAAREEAETAKAGEALSSEPEPVFAADPTAPAAPDDEDREALMKRVGVEKPPAPSDDELNDMLAALKKRAGDED